MPFPASSSRVGRQPQSRLRGTGRPTPQRISGHRPVRRSRNPQLRRSGTPRRSRPNRCFQKPKGERRRCSEWCSCRPRRTPTLRLPNYVLHGTNSAIDVDRCSSYVLRTNLIVRWCRGLCWDMNQEQRPHFADCATNNGCYPSEGRARGRFNEARALPHGPCSSDRRRGAAGVCRADRR